MLLAAYTITALILKDADLTIRPHPDESVATCYVSPAMVRSCGT